MDNVKFDAEIAYNMMLNIVMPKEVKMDIQYGSTTTEAEELKNSLNEAAQKSREQKIRFEFNVKIGYPPEFSRTRDKLKFEDDIIYDITADFGGCDSYHTLGYWSEESYINSDGDEVYVVDKEECFNINVSVTSENKHEAYKTIQKSIEAAVRYYNAPISWIHCTVHQVEQLHFYVDSSVKQEVQNG